jgi:aromatic ring-opening dioxygenase LigB subunit
MKQVEVIFDKTAYKEYSKLQKNISENKKAKKKPTYEQLLSSINNTIQNIKINPHIGNLIPRKYLTKKAIAKYGTDKILRVELVGYWRLLYTLIGDEAKIIAFILEYIDHEEYNKIFDYKKK